MTDSPASTAIMLTCWRRPYYFEQALHSWSNADGIGKVARLVIALGATDRVTQQLALIERLRPKFACPVEVAFQSERALRSPGVHRAIAEAVTGIFADPAIDFVITGEEDIVVSSDVLAYMEWARHRFAPVDEVLWACAHNKGGQGYDQPGVYDSEDTDQHKVRLLPYFNGWVAGTWRDRWEKTLEPNWDYECNTGSKGYDSGWDWQIQDRLIPGMGLLCAVPDASRSQNIGEHEGIYANPTDFGATQARSFRPERPSGGYELVSG